MNEPLRPVVAVVLDGILDDWLEPLGLDTEDFCEVMLGSWLFNYVTALRSVGVESVIVATARVHEPVLRVHRPTGARIWLLPASSTSRRLLAALEKLPLPRRRRDRLRWAVSELFSTPVDSIEQVLREERPGIVLVQDYESSRFDAMVALARKLSLPVFGTFTGNQPQSLPYRLRRGRSMRRATGFVICSQGEIDRIRAQYGVAAGKVRKVFYPIDRAVWFPEDRASMREALGLSRDATIAVFHGMIHMGVKGLDILLDAWQRLDGGRAARNRQLVILGDGVDARRLSERIRSGGRADILFRNEWHHDRALIRRYLSAADVYVFPSRVDAFGIAVTEAMACGLPVVAAAGRGMADILPEGELSGGIVVPSGDATAFAEALGRMMEDGALRQRVGANARRRISDPAFGEGVGRALKEFLLA